jgi:DNA-binding response OmpR family regulator
MFHRSSKNGTNAPTDKRERRQSQVHQKLNVKQILVVEDETRIARIVRDYLERAGYRVAVAGNGNDALAFARSRHPDLIVLDLGLPQIDGLEVTKAVRKQSNVPIIMLTARVEESDKVIGLELGADDYITKPFSPKELVARVRAVFRRIDPYPSRPLSFVREMSNWTDCGCK